MWTRRGHGSARGGPLGQLEGDRDRPPDKLTRVGARRDLWRVLGPMATLPSTLAWGRLVLAGFRDGTPGRGTRRPFGLPDRRNPILTQSKQLRPPPRPGPTSAEAPAWAAADGPPGSSTERSARIRRGSAGTQLDRRAARCAANPARGSLQKLTNGTPGGGTREVVPLQGPQPPNFAPRQPGRELSMTVGPWAPRPSPSAAPDQTAPPTPPLPSPRNDRALRHQPPSTRRRKPRRPPANYSQDAGAASGGAVRGSLRALGAPGCGSGGSAEPPPHWGQRPPTRGRRRG
jgi:hypothetical protein